MSQHSVRTGAPSSSSLNYLKPVMMLNLKQQYNCGCNDCKYYNENQPFDRPLLEEKHNSGMTITLKCFSCETKLFPCECCCQLFSLSEQSTLKFCSFCAFPNVAKAFWRRKWHDMLSSDRDSLEALKYVQLQLMESCRSQSNISVEQEYFNHLENDVNDTRLVNELFCTQPVSLSAAQRKSMSMISEPRESFDSSDFKMLKSLYEQDVQNDPKMATFFDRIETYFVNNESLHSLVENIKQYSLASLNLGLIPNKQHIKAIFKNQFITLINSLDRVYSESLYPKVIKPVNEHLSNLSSANDSVTQQSSQFFNFPFAQPSVAKPSDSVSLFEKRFILWRRLCFHLSFITHTLTVLSQSSDLQTN